jgi:glycosyltransferase involved in cell wall biosynthesis
MGHTLGLPPSAVVYLTIGRVDAAKDHKTLLRAFARIAPQQPEAHLLMLGKGGLADVLAAEARALGVTDRVRFVPSAPRAAPFFALADVFAFPSLLEGLPVALLEAMCAGLPCIASDIAPHLEVVRQDETGLLFPRGSAEALAAAMNRLYRDKPLRARLGATARAEAEALVSADRVILQWQATWERLARRS